ncbi:MAG: hypothetical protein J7L82_00250 [Staphylothermus sp.]|nr:hypothetical protein [Staphylothermus sp.]
MKKQALLKTLVYRELLEAAKPKPLEYVSFLARVKAEKQKKRLKTGEIKEYITYRLTIPREAAEKLRLDPEEDNLLVVRIAKPKWYHLMNYNDKDVAKAIWKKLPTWIKTELCTNKLAPEQLCNQYQTTTLILTQQEIKELDLDPNKPITLKELEKKILEKHTKKTNASLEKGYSL